MNQTTPLNLSSGDCPDTPNPYAPFKTRDARREWHISRIRRVLEHCKYQKSSGMWLAVEEVEDMLSLIPEVEWLVQPR